jgi:hypothetical protein
MQPQPLVNAAMRKFRLVQFLSLAIKVAALLGLFVFLAAYYGGH